MTGSDLSQQVSRRLDVPLKDAQVLVREFFSSIVIECLSVPRVELRGFGTFSAVRRRPRPGRNFQSGKRILVPDRLVLKFKPAKPLIARVTPSRPSPSPTE